MTEPQWRYHTPERDGHTPVDWVEGMELEAMYNENVGYVPLLSKTGWYADARYRYRPLQDATYEPDLLAQCLALPQDQREALIEAMQKPQRDWADEVADAVALEWSAARHTGRADEAAAVIRSMCRPKEVELSDEQIDDILRRVFGATKEYARYIIREALS